MCSENDLAADSRHNSPIGASADVLINVFRFNGATHGPLTSVRSVKYTNKVPPDYVDVPAFCCCGDVGFAD